MLLSNYQPVSKLVTRVTPVQRPAFPVIDAHNHLDNLFTDLASLPVSQLLDRLDEVDIRVYVDLDGGWGEDVLQRHLDRYKAAAPERFLIFGGVDWSKWPQQGDRFADWAASRLRQQVAWGAQGLKIWKPFGLHVRDDQNRLVRVNDPRLQLIWETASELRLPVMIHVADPVAFFDPVNETNERWEELQANPDWAFTSPPFPSFLSILEDFAAMVERNPQTTFIGAHVGCYAENLGWVANLLDRCPNFYIDISARLGELGRQPYTARRFFTRYSDRILFGTDIGPDPEGTRIFYRFLETDDEYFNYNPGQVPSQGRWHIYGIHLPNDALVKIYHANAMRALNLESIP